MRFAALLAVCAPLAAQTWYKFAIDQDRVAGAPDFSALNSPLGAADRIFVRNGRFFRVGPDLAPNTEDDARVRFFGVNLAFGANFPEAKDAQRIARRLRRLGVNLVRLHHMDTQPDRNEATANSLITDGPFPTLNRVSAERLRYFIQALASEGVYINLNLHVGYTFRAAADGVPADSPHYGKPAHILHPKTVELESQYARAVLAALGLNDDPALAMVEINNEDSLVYSWQVNTLERDVTGPYLAEMRQQWNRFLQARYSGSSELRTAWGGSPEGPQLLAPSGWRLEVHAPSRATLRDGVEAAVAVEQGGGWVYAKMVGFSVTAGQPYLAEVEIRADLPDGESRTVVLDAKEDVSPWRSISSRSVAATNRWTKVSLTFQPNFSLSATGRFALDVQACAGHTVFLRNPVLKNAGRRGLGEAESLEAGTVGPVWPTESGTERRTEDFLLYLADADRSYLNQVAATVRESAGPLVPITGSQMSFGGLLNLDSHDGMDYIDHHFYVDHYNFPNVQWDGYDWTFRDVSMAGDGFAALLAAAALRQAGKPYTVSEFNQPWPNRHAAEHDLAVAAFGAFQDWDGVMHFAYAHGRGWDDNVPNGFNLNGDWSKWVNFGQSAWLFRNWALRPGMEPVDLPVSLAARLRATREKRNGGAGSFLAATAGYSPALAFEHPVGISKDSAEPASAEARRQPASPYRSDTGELSYDARRRLYRIEAPMAAGVVGFAGTEKAAAGPLEVELAAGGRGFVVLLATALDGQPLESSGRILLSHSGATLRTQPRSDPPRPQELVKYPGRDVWTVERDPAQPSKPSGNLNGGSRPVWMERIPAAVTLRSTRPALRVYPLDGTGARLAPIEASATAGGFRIELQADGQAFSPWYEIVAE